MTKTKNLFKICAVNSSIAQSVEHLTVNQGVTGSSPVRGAISENNRAHGVASFLFGDFMIDSRLRAILNFVPQNSRVADIGTDHGYLAIELAKIGRSNFIIAGDKNFGPIQAAQKNISDAGLEKIIETRQGDGLKILRAGEVDTICIAGMGGGLICEILNAAPENLSTTENLILQPMNAVEKVTVWLENNFWLVGDSDLAEVGGIIYEIIFAVKNPEKISSPTKKEKSPLLKKFLEQSLKKFLRVQNEMMKSPAAVKTEKFLQLQNKIEQLKAEIKK